MKITKAALIATMFFILSAEIAYSSGIMTSVLDGTRADLKLDEKQKTIDVYLSDIKTKKAITDASVIALVRLPNGEKKEITLTGMEMNGMFSYMNSLDTAKKGDYIFRIKVLRGKKELIFSFTWKR
ncbi:MAG: hypothetical protein WA162_08370 [Thermodesulfobacteriota bacterium]